MKRWKDGGMESLGDGRMDTWKTGDGEGVDGVMEEWSDEEKADGE